VGLTYVEGVVIDRDVSECHIALPQGEGHTPVILGEAGDEAPRTLQPARLLLA